MSFGTDFKEKMFTRVTTVQDLINKDIFDEAESNNNQDMLQLLDFMKNNGVPLTDHQVQAMFLLAENGLEDIAYYMNAVRPMLTPTKQYFDMVNKITMADRIKGTAKLDKLLKASVASPNGQVPSAGDLQAKGLKEKELGGRV